MSELGEFIKVVKKRKKFLIERLLDDFGYEVSGDASYLYERPLDELEHLYIKEASSFGRQMNRQQGGMTD